VSPSDADLAREALAGSQTACRELVARYASVAVNFLARMVRDRALAEDLAQESFLRAFQRLSSYDRQRKFLNWFLQIAYHVAVDHQRRKALETVSLDSLVAAGHPGAADESSASSPEVLAQRAELASTLEQALSVIRAEYRIAIVLHYQEGLGHADLSEILGVPVATVKTFLHRGRKALAALLAQHGWAPSETLRPVDP
jgi:RNA polymerase sigma-70 factor (ECF subfamily)